MNVIVNGEKKDFAQEQITVTSLLKLCNVEMPEMVSVQVNGKFVDKANFESTTVDENDEVDFLYFMGGGTL